MALVFPVFMLGTIIVSVIQTWVYVNTRSVLINVLLHATVNLMGAIGSPFPMTTALLGALALIVVAMHGLGLSKERRSAGSSARAFLE